MEAETNIDFSLYGTPLESTTYKFARCLQKRFGVIEGVTDRNYITNSYHIHVTENIDAFDKLTFESQFQALTRRSYQLCGSAEYAEQHRGGPLPVMQHIYDNIMYARA